MKSPIKWCKEAMEEVEAMQAVCEAADEYLEVDDRLIQAKIKAWLPPFEEHHEKRERLKAALELYLKLKT
jgi:hypothetical protein